MSFQFPIATFEGSLVYSDNRLIEASGFLFRDGVQAQEIAAYVRRVLPGAVVAARGRMVEFAGVPIGEAFRLVQAAVASLHSVTGA
jgi:hypothetical protein